SHRVDDERVAVPLADRIAEPRRRRIVWKRAAVREDLAEDGLHFIEDQHFTLGINYFEWLRQEIGMGHSIWEASQVWPDHTRLSIAPQNFRAFGRQWFFTAFEIGEDVAKVSRVLGFADPEQCALSPRLTDDLPDALQIRLAVDATDRASHVDLAVRC